MPTAGDSRARRSPVLSCAECRRLKLKCSRAWPCAACVKRGLAEICPEGSLATRPRQKPPPPTPEHVVQRIHELQARINELERALAALQATVSPDPHPLLPRTPLPYLHQKLLRKTAFERALKDAEHPLPAAAAAAHPLAAAGSDDDGASDEIADALGTLNIAPDGKSRFFGPTAVSEGLAAGEGIHVLMGVQGPAPSAAALPVDIAAVAQAFPFATLTDAVARTHAQIRAFLPPIERADALSQCYFSYASFVANTVPEDDVFEGLFCRLYGAPRAGAPAQAHAGAQPVGADELAVFFGVLALGVLTDLAGPPFSSEAATYAQLARALLTGDSVLTAPTLASVQALFLGSYYEGMQSQGSSSRDCWIMMVLAAKSAQILGLHRDHGVFGVDAREVQRRRLVFWEVYSLDTIESLAFGRPVALPYTHTDTRMPADTHAIQNAAGETEESFYAWKYRFCAEVLAVVGDHVLRVKTPSYGAALAADRALRAFKTTFGSSAGRADAHAAAQLQMMLGTRETSALYIHRLFFAHALATAPGCPERSRYGRSVVAAFASARAIVEGMQGFVRGHAAFGARLWFLWNHLLSASFVLGSIAARAPGSGLAPHALGLLGTVCGLLRGVGAAHGGRAGYMLPVVARLEAKGHAARGEHVRGDGRGGGGEWDADDALDVIGGKARVVWSGAAPVYSEDVYGDVSGEVYWGMQGLWAGEGEWEAGAGDGVVGAGAWQSLMQDLGA